MKKTRFLLLATAISTLALSGCFESESDNNAQSNAGSNAAIESPADAGQAATTASAPENAVTPDSITGVYCEDNAKMKSSLVVMDIPNMDTLSLSFQSWNKASGHGCGIANIVADKTGDNEWLYSLKEDGIDCMINITADDEKVTLNEISSSCRNFCGAGAQIGTMTFPKSSKTKSDVTKYDLESEACK